jgi:hemolysin activation/secretion protein
MDAVSAFTPGAFSVDEGVTGRAELQRTVELPKSILNGSATPYLFAAAGRGVLRQPTLVEQSIMTAGSFGAGTRINFENFAGRFENKIGLEVGRQLSDVASAPDGYRVNVSASVKY